MVTETRAPTGIGQAQVHSAFLSVYDSFPANPAWNMVSWSLWHMLVLILTCSICLIQACIDRSKDRRWKYLLQQYNTKAK